MSESSGLADVPSRPRRRALLIGTLVATVIVIAAIVALVVFRPTATTGPEGIRSDGSATVTSSATRTPSPTPAPTASPTPTATEPAPPPAEPAPPPPPEPVCADDVLVCVNIARAANGLGALAADGTLDAAAQECADRMAASGQLAHSAGGPGGYGYWGENVAVGYPSAAAVFEGWMGSDGHRANILNPNYTSMGIGYASGNWWCQQFGG